MYPKFFYIVSIELNQWLGNGTNCTDVDECADDSLWTCEGTFREFNVFNHLSSEGKVGKKCINYPGTYDCECAEGYRTVQ